MQQLMFLEPGRLEVQEAPAPELRGPELFLADVTFRTGMAHTHPSRGEALALVAAGRLHPELVTAAQVAWDDAVDALRHATGKLVVTRSW
jgi:threonine dehydrogenase-like Zn-dependent dehydrogenase